MAGQTIDYYYSLVSPFTYMGHDRFTALAKKHKVTVRFKPVDLMKVFSVSGGIPVKDRAPQRKAYRLIELKRLSEFAKIDLNVQPKHFPVPDQQACRVVLAAAENGGNPGKLTGAFLRAVWSEERNISDPDTIRKIIAECGEDEGLFDKGEEPGTGAIYDANTREAIQRQVFGAPTWVLNGELFWGQDRLELLAWRLKQG